MQNIMQALQMLNQIKNSNDPMGMLQNMFGNNPNFNRAIQMTQGKSQNEIEQTVRNIASQRGVNVDQIKQLASQFGIKM